MKIRGLGRGADGKLSISASCGLEPVSAAILPRHAGTCPSLPASAAWALLPPSSFPSTQPWVGGYRRPRDEGKSEWGEGKSRWALTASPFSLGHPIFMTYIGKGAPGMGEERALAVLWTPQQPLPTALPPKPCGACSDLCPPSRLDGFLFTVEPLPLSDTCGLPAPTEDA